MSSAETIRLEDLKVDVANLYREEVYTDLRVANLRVLQPVKPDGTPDPSREPQFLASTSIMTQAGALPVNAPIEAATLKEALDKFPQAVKEGVEQMLSEVREMHRQYSQRIVVPEAGMGGLGGLGGPAGAGPAPSKLVL